jgi:hypothetical protein
MHSFLEYADNFNIFDENMDISKKVQPLSDVRTEGGPEVNRPGQGGYRDTTAPRQLQQR